MVPAGFDFHRAREPRADRLLPHDNDRAGYVSRLAAWIRRIPNPWRRGPRGACVIPPQWDAKIAIHFAHRIGALTVTLLILATTGHVFFHHRRRAELRRPAMLLLVLLALQITLGALTVLSQKQFIINSLHVVNGALVLVTSLVLTLRAHRARFAESAEAGSAAPFAQRDPAHVPA
ncbi:MAG: hypothetical protein DMF87_20550 [Acidobacteria bacterium]|nr:MAG: hypothetical protein DMF87_20550 [Acidobacteriota bacterium]